MSGRRYLLFCGDDYYPQGGPEDLVAWADDVPSLRKLLTSADVGFSSRVDWWTIFDTETGRVVAHHGANGHAPKTLRTPFFTSPSASFRMCSGITEVFQYPAG